MQLRSPWSCQDLGFLLETEGLGWRRLAFPFLQGSPPSPLESEGDLGKDLFSGSFDAALEFFSQKPPYLNDLLLFFAGRLLLVLLLLFFQILKDGISNLLVQYRRLLNK